MVGIRSCVRKLLKRSRILTPKALLVLGTRASQAFLTFGARTPGVFPGLQQVPPAAAVQPFPPVQITIRHRLLFESIRSYRDGRRRLKPRALTPAEEAAEDLKFQEGLRTLRMKYIERQQRNYIRNTRSGRINHALNIVTSWERRTAERNAYLDQEVWKYYALLVRRYRSPEVLAWRERTLAADPDLEEDLDVGFKPPPPAVEERMDTVLRFVLFNLMVVRGHQNIKVLRGAIVFKPDSKPRITEPVSTALRSTARPRRPARRCEPTPVIIQRPRDLRTLNPDLAGPSLGPCLRVLNPRQLGTLMEILNM
ncbi:hypothetical protein DFH06DRAFT_1302752 [Mycena polygramma]|nr:hypothetical protein DFH06DRAFT_1302752 [Mycena polygramma]